MTPTEELYSAMQVAYMHFNDSLFNKQLPPVLFTTQRQHGVLGYFAPNRWSSNEGNNCHEIAINPLYVGRATLIEVMQTLVHEMAHCWQQCYGKPSRRAYHNQEWANKMLEVGLVPSSTGQPGGKMVGQRMCDYPAPEGKFIVECKRLFTDKKFILPWVDRFSLRNGRTEDFRENLLPDALGEISEELLNQLTTSINALLGHQNIEAEVKQAQKKVKAKYSCPKCMTNVWGKTELRIRCDDCDELMEERSKN